MNENIIQITAGRGPAECCWVVAQVLKKFMEEAKQFGLSLQVLDREEGSENGTLLSAMVLVKGEGAASFLDTWLGTIQWIGHSKFRKLNKRKNWFIGINLLESIDNEYLLKESDIKYEFVRSGGPGGQHVNKVNTAVRAIHIPSGNSVFVSENRSQLQNKKAALERLQNVLKTYVLNARQERLKKNWQNHDKLERGNPKRIFLGDDFKPNHENKKYRSGRKSEKQKFRRYELD